MRRYCYDYDGLSRLKKATYQKPGAATVVTNSYNETVSYDKNGNIQTLLRNGDYDDAVYNIPIDNLTYTYDTADKNKLVKVEDTSNNTSGFKDSPDNNTEDYTYDAYGNMLTDSNKGITSIIYNHLNLPVEIVFNNNSDSKISYLYDATGQKVRKSVTKPLNGGIVRPAPTTTDYLDGYQYNASELQYFPTAEGYVDRTKSGSFDVYSYVFQYKDHLGNVRMNYAVDPLDNVLKIKEENHYYPFGLKHANYNGEYLEFQQIDQVEEGMLMLAAVRPAPTPEFQKAAYDYKYNGKEYQDELGINWYDYGARNYDAALGRWMNIDPLAEVRYHNSPFVYCNNNPVIFIDPDGMDFTLSGAAAQAWVSNLQDAMDGAENGNYQLDMDWDTGAVSAVFDMGLAWQWVAEMTGGSDGGNTWISTGVQPLTKSTLLKYVKENFCQNCSEGQLQRRAGLFFEAQFGLFATSMTPSKFKFRKGEKLYGPRNTIPDFVADIFKINQHTGKEYRIPGAAAYEVKATDGTLYMSSSTNQIKGHIQNMASKFTFFEWTHSSKPSLTLVTTYDVSISNSVVNNTSGVFVNQVVSYYTMVSNTMVISFGPKQ